MDRKEAMIVEKCGMDGWGMERTGMNCDAYIACGLRER